MNFWEVREHYFTFQESGRLLNLKSSNYTFICPPRLAKSLRKLIRSVVASTGLDSLSFWRNSRKLAWILYFTLSKLS